MSPKSQFLSNGNMSVPPLENGFPDSLSEKSVEELVQQPLRGFDDHLFEFSEALRTVVKALRQVAEGKASAQAEAAEWKRKYELERERNHKSEKKGKSQFESDVEKLNGMIDHDFELNDVAEQPDLCCGKNDICSHEVLRDGETDSNNTIAQNKLMKKASFKLSWCCEGDKIDRHKHDIVSFEKGNITTAERSSKQGRSKNKLSRLKTRFCFHTVLTSETKHNQWSFENLICFFETTIQISLKWQSPPKTVFILTKPNSISVQILCSQMVRWLKEHKKLNIIVEPRVRSELLNDSPYYDFVETWKDDNEVLLLHTKVDLVITLGGDGTVLWAASMFKGPVPPLVPFSLGSLGFMTPFYSEHYQECLSSILRGPISITLRHRLQCSVIRDSAKSENENEGPILVLNELTIDRGISSFLTNLECYCDNSFVTCVQGDGLILSTTSGSTAYSLAAGGSMVHPQVPAILFTPICPHSLSFRPLILPEHVTVRVQVPFNSRGHAWASFDGKDRKKLNPGDALVCSMAPWPVPTACQTDSTSDFLRSIHDGLHWNLRKTQSFDGPRDS